MSLVQEPVRPASVEVKSPPTSIGPTPASWMIQVPGSAGSSIRGSAVGVGVGGVDVVPLGVDPPLGVEAGADVPVHPTRLVTAKAVTKMSALVRVLIMDAPVSGPGLVSQLT
ncbi:hypothetical protein L687_15680 [Microbacterium maritypicum MF109]|uniref:Uncharacterized protein n=1 Tax=Microbacterium maritypicum MF109 TaxID=1333857 RepID=T5KBM2_MICMQ|nr:hypothetical protein L687_15680 [Microbacterium maritypicum MF109]